MSNIARRLSLYIPKGNWLRCGTWKETLDEDLKLLKGITPRLMTIKTVSGSFSISYPFDLGIDIKQQNREYVPLSGLPGYEYSWDTTDGRSLDVLNFRGPPDIDILLVILKMIEGAGFPIVSTYDALVIFSE